MIHRYPKYFKEFRCIASKCEATCCSGWQIVIDDESLDVYKTLKDDYREELLNGILVDESVFKQRVNRDCHFLNRDKLCNIYKSLGEEYLCFTCKNYPRHIEEFEEVNEVSLAISCPVVTELILNLKEKVTFYEVEEEWVQVPFEEFDFMFFDILLEVRSVIFSVVQDRSIEFYKRILLTERLVKVVQEKIEDDIFAVQDILEEFCIRTQKECDGKEWKKIYAENKDSMLRLFELEELQEGWKMELENAVKQLYGQGIEEYRKQKELFYAKNMLEVEKEQLMVYFLFTYFCGAVYDGDLWGKYNLAQKSVYFIEELWFAKWLKNRDLTDAEKIRVVYRYARELEHSDFNLELMESF